MAKTSPRESESGSPWRGLLPMPPYDWQLADWTAFCQRIQSGRLPHAFMLCGREGIGVEALAMAMGQYLLCLSPIESVACGKCRSCQLLAAGTHPDLSVVELEEKAKQIKIEQIRGLSDKVDQTALQGGAKVIIVQPTEAMNINAANALLKRLEEPSGNTVFILCSFQSARVLPTIRSRCALVKLADPSYEVSLEWLKTKKVEGADRLLHDASGAPLLALKWANEGIDVTRMELLKDLVDLSENRLSPMTFGQKWAKNAPLDVLEPMQVALYTVLVEKMAGKECPVGYEGLRRATRHLPANHIMRLHDHLNDQKAQFQRSPNLNPALFIEELALDWSAVIKAA